MCVCVCVLPECMSVQCPWRSEVGTSSPRAGVNNMLSLCECWELSMTSVEEQQVLITPALFLKINYFIFEGLTL